MTFGQTILKNQAIKVRTLHQKQVIAGFAGSAADALALFEKLEGRLEEFRGNLTRAAIELAKDWRSDRALRHLQAQIIACNKDTSMLISGTGDVILPDDDILSIGSGSAIAMAGARMLLKHTELSAEEIVREALETTATICIYTNDSITIERLDLDGN